MSHYVRGQRTQWVLQWAEEKMAESTGVRCTVAKVVTTDMMGVGQTFLIENLSYHVMKYRPSCPQGGLLNKHCEFPMSQ
jgi:hypothetical protein